MNIIKGFQDTFPEEMERRRYCENRLTDTFKKWGYQEIDTPTLEYYDVLIKGIGPELRDRMFKLLNVDGDIIVLRPDMTTPIARLAATKLRKVKEHFIKFYYLNHVFRKCGNSTEDQQEFHQAGIELLGLDSRLADAEVIAVAIKALINAGLSDFYIDIGSAGFFNSIMDKLPLIPEYKKILRESIMNKDFVLLEKLLYRYNLPRKDREIILQLPHWRGDKSVIGEAEKLMEQNDLKTTLALQEVKEVYQYLKMYGLEKYILIDLGIIRDFDYYTGIVFEGYTSNAGSAICGGGRYDHLCQKFGKDIPSTGIAIGVEKLLRVLAQINQTESKDFDCHKFFIRYRKELVEIAYHLAEKLRNRDYLVEMELEFERSMEKAIQYASSKKIRYVIDIQSKDLSNTSRYDLLTKREEKVTYEV